MDEQYEGVSVSRISADPTSDDFFRSPEFVLEWLELFVKIYGLHAAVPCVLPARSPVTRTPPEILRIFRS